ncbi:hypothetical protein CGCA056_v003627 [Colletotrichum aenigma]|uniref:uncharacterized protein n=1 Tax=Colletotrichum aenigma TaxID=1215731 RepID=UPI001872DE80|nr:uncharacterized protein CGCA056_v003627 [Colletotrichum aenigma]KAF5526323.1 hypothetical protein CGCA056_v003627 [Colletotrichum aenigma]
MASSFAITNRPRKRAREVDPPCSSLASPPSSDPSTSPPNSATLLASAETSYQTSHTHSNLQSPPAEVAQHEPSNPPARRRRLAEGPLHGPKPPSSRYELIVTPQLPRECPLELNFSSPFEDHVETRQLEGLNYVRLEKGIVNGYIKLGAPRLAAGHEGDDNRQKSPHNKLTVWLRAHQYPDQWFEELHPTDQRFFGFYIVAWCSGRTVLRRTNTWLVDIAQMAYKDNCVKHALLALAGTYVFDYRPLQKYKDMAEYHYKRAVILLSLQLGAARNDSLSDGDMEAVLAAIALLNMNDVVCSEHWRLQKRVPRWLDGARLSCQLLDTSDPGHRYRDPVNIQPSDARVGNAILASRAAIFALPMMPLMLENTKDKQFVWLLQGSELNTSRIHGGCGMSPSLLYQFAQITHLAALTHLDPVDSSFFAGPMALRMLHDLLGLSQWYEFERATGVTKVKVDVDTIAGLLRSGHLDAHGAINSKEGMTASTAEAWRFAAIIYLQCRLLRLPRNHPDVLCQAANLAATIRVMPTSGYMFTAQAPFFPVFLLGVVAVEEEHSKCALDWFESVTETKCRSSVPPAYEALKKTREWMASNVHDAPLPIPDRIVDRHGWWEDVVDHVSKTSGTLCLV